MKCRVSVTRVKGLKATPLYCFNPQVNMLEFDEFLERAGSFGKYQICFCIILGLGSFTLGLNNMIIIFLAESPKHHCLVPSLSKLNLSEDVRMNYSIPFDSSEGTYESCRMYNRNYSGVTSDLVYSELTNPGIPEPEIIPCQYGWDYDKSIYESTIITEWNIVCDHRWLRATATSVYMVGLMIGSSIFGWIADSYGRKISLRVAAVPLVSFTIAACFSPNLTVFIIIRTIVAMTNMPFFSVSGVLVSEIVPRKWRSLAVSMGEIPWNFGFMYACGIGYAIRDRFKLQIFAAVPVVLMLAYLFVVDESPRWLYVRGRVEEAKAITRKIAHWNKATDALEDDVFVKQETKSSKNVFDLFRTPKLRIRTFIFVFIWSSSMLGFYVLAFSTSALAGNQYLNAFLGAIIVLPCYPIGITILARFGRRNSLCVMFIIPGILMLCTIPMGPGTPYGSIETVILLVKRLVLATSWLIKWLFTMELYPTEIRNLAIGMILFLSRIGAITAPYFAQLSRENRIVTICVIGAMEIISGLLTLLLPETKNQNLPDTIGDVEGPVSKSSKAVERRGDEMKELEQKLTSSDDPADGNVTGNSIPFK